MFTWLSGSKIKALIERVNEQEKAIAEYVLTFERYSGKIPEYCTVQGGFCTSTGMMLWEKDLNSQYTYMNMRHCNEFYNLPYSELNHLLGKTSAELLNELNKKEGEENTFGKICRQSDRFVIESKQLSRFWEMGYVNGKIFILDVKKQPLYEKNGDLKGVRGWATSLTDRECEVKTLIEIYLKNGIATRLDKDYDNGSACYVITKQNNTFNRRFLK